MIKVNLIFIMDYMSNKKFNGFKNRVFIIIKLYFIGKNVLFIKFECYFYILNVCFDVEKKVFFLFCFRRFFLGYFDFFVFYILYFYFFSKIRDYFYLFRIFEIFFLKRFRIRSFFFFWVGSLFLVEL